MREILDREEDERESCDRLEAKHRNRKTKEEKDWRKGRTGIAMVKLGMRELGLRDPRFSRRRERCAKEEHRQQERCAGVRDKHDSVELKRRRIGGPGEFGLQLKKKEL